MIIVRLSVVWSNYMTVTIFMSCLMMISSNQRFLTVWKCKANGSVGVGIAGASACLVEVNDTSARQELIGGKLLHLEGNTASINLIISIYQKYSRWYQHIYFTLCLVSPLSFIRRVRGFHFYRYESLLFNKLNLAVLSWLRRDKSIVKTEILKYDLMISPSDASWLTIRIYIRHALA